MFVEHVTVFFNNAGQLTLLSHALVGIRLAGIGDMPSLVVCAFHRLKRCPSMTSIDDDVFS